MDSAQEMSSPDKENLEGNVIEGMSHPEVELHHESDVPMKGEGEHEDLPKGVKDRLGRQEKRHQKEMRQMRAQIEALQSQLSQPISQTQDAMTTPYSSTPGGIDEQIHKAVSLALQHKEMQERKALEESQKAHVAKQYHELQKHLDNMADRYDDFHEVVMGNDAPFTAAMRDYSLTLPKSGAGSAGEVLYKLGKNPEELSRIAKLHPLDQAAEMARLSHALISGGEPKSSTPRPIGQIKSNPVTNSHMVSDKTPISELRKRMKSGWK